MYASNSNRNKPIHSEWRLFPGTVPHNTPAVTQHTTQQCNDLPVNNPEADDSVCPTNLYINLTRCSISLISRVLYSFIFAASCLHCLAVAADSHVLSVWYTLNDQELCFQVQLMTCSETATARKPSVFAYYLVQICTGKTAILAIICECRKQHSTENTVDVCLFREFWRQITTTPRCLKWCIQLEAQHSHNNTCKMYESLVLATWLTSVVLPVKQVHNAWKVSQESHYREGVANVGANFHTQFNDMIACERTIGFPWSKLGLFNT